MNLVQQVDITAKSRIILRCDLNLPQNNRGEFTDFFRLESSLPTIEYLKESGATIFITSHLGSPEGKVNQKLSLKYLTGILSDQLNKKVKFISDPFDTNEGLEKQKGIFLIENLRFWPEEEASDLEFAMNLVKVTGAEFFVQDAFGAIHRDHASITKLPKVLPSAAGFLLQKEISSLQNIEETNLVLLVGGAKVESKLPVISNFLNTADSVLTGGVVANTFLKALEKNIAASLFDDNCLSLANQITNKSEYTETKILLPEDYICAKSPDELLAHEFDDTNIKPDQMILDIGQSTIDKYREEIDNAEVILWAGTLGFAEKPPFSKGSKSILDYLIESKKNRDLKIIIGGGDTVDFVKDNLNQQALELIDHLSTGGGASLLMLSGEELPGIKALETSPDQFDNEFSQENTYNTDENDRIVKLSGNSPTLIANLKSHFSLEESVEWFQQFITSESLVNSNIKLCVAPSNISLGEFRHIIESSNLKRKPDLYSQNISHEDEGSDTGEIAATQIKNLAEGTIIGHSERRIKHEEDDQIVFEKVIKAIDNNLKVILCVGGKSKDELNHQREVYKQLKSVFDNLNSQQTDLIIVAYEPVFSIGTGKVPSGEFLLNQLKSIKDFLSDQRSVNKILYGGSVTPDNARQILKLGFNGLLVGSASLNVKSLEDIGNNISA
ncbi:MAG TPA: phosphoglycerate kinase [Candidatus Saccharimonadales bacterium]|nr:phosphoglycerate kinase [Candidatus Saccharimonadales bacterium]